MIRPSFEELGLLGAVRVTAMLVAPSALTISIAAKPTLLLAAVMTTTSAFVIWPSQISAP